MAKLERPWFSGGTIVAAFVGRAYHQDAPGAAHFEDGTLDYLNIPAVEIGLQDLDRIGIDAIHTHTAALGRSLLDELTSLRHADGSPAATIYGPRSWERRGATIAFSASLGIAFNARDVERFSVFASEFVDLTATPDGLRRGLLADPRGLSPLSRAGGQRAPASAHI